LLITPLLNEEDVFDTDAIDLRLGCHFLLSQVPPQPYFSPDLAASGHPYHQRVHVPVGQHLVVPAHETVLGATLEFIKLPHNVAGQILTKSSVARTFVVIETAPWVHPYYRGCLTLEIANVSNTPVLLHPGRLIGQLVLFDVPDAAVPQKLVGRYLGPIYPEAPKVKTVATELACFGVNLPPQ
jgi:dCTP deaminase